MNPKRVSRESTRTLRDLPNVGPAIEKLLQSIGIDEPQQLKGCDPFALYKRLGSSEKGADPCLLDVLMSIVSFMDGNEPQVWWAFTEQRKQMLAVDKRS